MSLTTQCTRYATVCVLAGLGLFMPRPGALHAAAPNGWTGDVPLNAPAPLRTLYVDRSSKGGPCSDAYTAAANAQAQGKKPWCTLGVAGVQAMAGDLVLVRSGLSTAANPDGAYNEPTAFGSGLAVLTLVNRGQAAHPIIFKAYPGERPVLDPLTRQPGICSGCVTFGVAAGYDAPTKPCPNQHCDYYVIIDGFTLTHWSVWDHDPTAYHYSHYAMAFTNQHGNLGHITVRNCELAPGSSCDGSADSSCDSGAGVLFTLGVYAFTFEYNYVHDNSTHGWTSPLNFWQPLGALEGPNTVRGNFVANNKDAPPPNCLQNYCAGGTNTCFDSVHGSGDLCPCVVNANCQSGLCMANPSGGGCSDQAGSSDGNTEGHGIIIDSGGTHSAFLIESNVLYGNYGTCIAVFQSDHVNLRNNTCDHNGLRGRRNDGEILTWGAPLQVHNNIVVTRSTGTCSCSTNSDCGGVTGWCAPATATQFLANTCVTGAQSVCRLASDCLHGNACVSPIALGLAYGGSLFPADPATIAEGANMFFSPNPALTDIMRLADDVQRTLADFQNSADAQKYGWGKGDLGSDPLFIGAPDFRLQAGSPAINSGDPANHAPLDVLGNQYQRPDRGAFKY